MPDTFQSYVQSKLSLRYLSWRVPVVAAGLLIAMFFCVVAP